MSATIKISTNTRLFIAVPMPERISQTLHDAIKLFPTYVDKPTPSDQWHLTLAWLGETENPHQYLSRLAKDMPQSFLPTIHLTHIGRGLQRTHLWAFAHHSNILTSIREDIMYRLRKMRYQFPSNTPDDFVPHVTVAQLLPHAGGIGLPDHPLNISFSFTSANVYLSKITPKGSQYDHVATINFAS